MDGALCRWLRRRSSEEDAIFEVMAGYTNTPARQGTEIPVDAFAPSLPH